MSLSAALHGTAAEPTIVLTYRKDLQRFQFPLNGAEARLIWETLKDQNLPPTFELALHGGDLSLGITLTAEERNACASELAWCLNNIKTAGF